MMHSNKPNPIEERLAALHQGPRMKSQATVDFEVVLKAFIAENPPSFVVNRLQEIEVTIDQQIYNFSKILEHHPDFEHIDFDALDARQNAFATGQLRELTSHATVDTSEISEAEARAIYYYSMSNPKSASFEKINRFLRENGKISDLNDVQTMMIIIAYYSKAMLKLRTLAQDKFENKTREEQQVFRGENYKTPRLAKAVADKRTLALTREAGFFSMSQQKAVSESFTCDNQRLNQQNILIELRQQKDVHGVDVARHSLYQHEQEVGFTAGTSFVYVKPHKHDNKLIAVPARSVDDIYYPHYQRQLIDIRTQMLRYLNTYAKEPAANSGLIKTIEKFCQNIFNYDAAEMVSTYIACNETLKTLESLSLNYKASVQARHYFSGSIQIIKQAAETAVQQEFSIVNAELLKAAQYAYEHHYINAYTQPEVSNADLSLTIDGVTIQRPNHGLAHVLRKALYIPIIYQLFLSHAKDSEFKDALSNLSAEQLKLIQIAILFSVSGRESELGVIDSKQGMAAYLTYRKKSKANFMAYMKHAGYCHPDKDNEFIGTLAEQVKYFGNPEFFKAITLGYPQPQKVCLYNMMNLAHNLDLMRCYNLEKIGPTLINIESALISLYLNKTFSEHGMPVLITMANDCLVATGDRQLVAPRNGKLVAVSRSYTSAFIAASTDAVACMKACMLINPIFVDMIYGKSNLTSSTNKLKFTLLHETFMALDMVGIATVVKDPEFKMDEMSTIQTLLYDIVCGSTSVAFDALLTEITTNDDCDPADLTTALFVAIDKKREDIALALIAKGAELRSVAPNGDTPLLRACALRMVNVVREILKRSDATLNMANDQHILPIRHAIASLCWEIVSELIRSPNIDLSGETGMFLLEQAIQFQQIDLIEETLSLHKNHALDAKPGFNMDPLIAAIKHLGSKKDELDVIAKMLIDYGMTVTVEHIKTAIKNLNWDLIIFLIENSSVDVNYPGYDYNLLKSTTLMHIAVYTNNDRLLESLIKRGAICDMKSPSDGLSAVELAIRNNALMATRLITEMSLYNPPPENDLMCNIIRLALVSKQDQLIEHAFKTFSSINTFKIDGYYHKILLAACEAANVTFVKMILTHYKFDICQHSSSLLLAAAKSAAKAESEEIIDLLLAHGVIVDAESAAQLVPYAVVKDNVKLLEKWLSIPGVWVDVMFCNTKTALSLACVNGHLEIATLLIQKNALLDHRPTFTTPDNGPLLSGIQGNHVDIVELLIKAGANTSKSFLACNPITYALSHHKVKVAEYLLTVPSICREHVSSIDEAGDTPLSLAIRLGKFSLVTTIIKKGANPNLPTSDFLCKQRLPVIMHAAKAESWEIVSLLLDIPEIEIHHSVNGNTLLQLACTEGREDIVKKIFQIQLKQIREDALKLDFFNQDNKTALSIAVLIRQKEIVQLFSQHNTNLVSMLNRMPDLGLAKLNTLFSTQADTDSNPVTSPWCQPH